MLEILLYTECINVLKVFRILYLRLISSFAVFAYYEKCANNRHKCSSFADCRDYDTGYCCHCRPGFYGDGKDCVAEGTLIST